MKQLKHRLMCWRLGLCPEHLRLRGWCMACFEDKLSRKRQKQADRNEKRHKRVRAYIIKYRGLQ